MPFKNFFAMVGGLLVIGCTAAVVSYYLDHQLLDEPGVMWKPIPGSLKVELILPEKVGECTSKSLLVTDDELHVLPPDTSFGRRRYAVGRWLNIDLSIVLMGGDQSSIHRPQACIPAQGWKIENESVAELQLGPGAGNAFKYNKMLSRKTVVSEGKPVEVECLYLYWFVSRDHVTHQRGGRMLSLAEHVLQTGKVERWAYVSAFAVFPVGSEAEVHEQMRQFLREAVPEFQLATEDRVANQ